MKKHFERSAFVALVIILAGTGLSTQERTAHPGVSTGTGQIIPAAPRSAAKDRIEIPFPSKVGDRARYAVTYISKGDSGETTAMTDLTVEVSRAVESGFLITWTYGEWHSSDPKEESDLEGRRILNLMRRVRLLLEADPRTIPTTLNLVNWEGLRTQLAQGREELHKQMISHGASRQEIDQLEAIVGPMYQNRQVMTAYYTKEANLFFSLLGQKIPISGSPESDMELANPFGGDPLPARGRISVKSYDPANHRAVLLDTTVLDPARAAGIFDKISRDLVAKFAPQLLSVVPEGISFKSISVAAQTEFDLDLESGWPKCLTYKTSMTFEMAPPGEGSVKGAHEEIISLKRIEGDARPDIMGAAAKWQALLKEAQDLSRQGQDERALETGEKALRLAELNLGPDHPDLAPILDAVAEFYVNDGSPREAEPLLERALAIREKALGSDHPDVEKALNGLADYYESLGQDAKVVTTYERVLAIREKALGPGHPEVAAILDKLARFHYYQRQYPEAESLWKRALAIRENALGPDRPEVAATLRDLAMLFQVQGRYAAAEPLWKRVLAIQEKTLGPNHPDLAPTLSMLAELYRATNREKEAEVLESRAARVLKRQGKVGGNI